MLMLEIVITDLQKPQSQARAFRVCSIITMLVPMLTLVIIILYELYGITRMF